MRYLILIAVMMLAGCANSSRNLTIHVHEGGTFMICHSPFSTEVMKSNTDERATNTPDIKPEVTIPLVPGGGL